MPANIPYLTDKKIIIVSGHFGSGKTCVSVALALALRAAEKNVTVADLDIVNPYFRAADSEALLTSHGIRCINPEFANTNVDIPSLGADIQSIFAISDKDENSVAILDVGGDSGAAALGRFRHEIERIGYDMLFVASKYRPLTETAEMTVENIREIEAYSRLSVSHIVNNSNIGEETTLEYVENSFAYADEICRLSGLPEAFTSVVKRNFCTELSEKYPEKNFFFIEDTTRKLF